MINPTRTFVEGLFSSMRDEGFSERFVDALDENLTWTATGNSPLGGVYRGKQEYLEKVLFPLRARLETQPIPNVESILVDGEWATVIFRSTGAKGKNGTDFSMQYCWVMRVVDQKFVEVIGFYDQKKVSDLFA